MFHLNERSGAKSDSSSNKENFGWWSSFREIAVSPRQRDEKNHRSLISTSMSSCVDSDDSDSYVFVHDLSRWRESESDVGEDIELSTFIRNDLGIDLIERDAKASATNDSSKTANDNECNNVGEETKTEDMYYTSDRLIGFQEYQILTSPSHYFVLSQAGFTPENEYLWKSWSCRKQLNCLIDSKQIESYTTSSPILTSEQRAIQGFVTPIGSNEIFSNHQDYSTWSTETINSCRSSNHKFNSTRDNCKKIAVYQHSLENTADIQNYEWSSNAHNDARKSSSMCLYDELLTTSRDYTVGFANNKNIAVNEVVSILEGLDRDPEKAMILLDEDRFCNCMSSHDQLTRLALTIETDTEELAILDDSDNWIRRLRDKIEQLQLANKEIYKDVCRLRANFQCDERRINDLSKCTRKLRQDVKEMRYLNDMLKMLREEFEVISERNCPFLLGYNNKSHGEVNLIV